MKGEYVTFIDSDDTVLPNYLERLLTALTVNSADVSVCSLKRGEKDKEEIFREDVVYAGEEACIEIYRPLKNDVVMVVSCAKLYKQKCFNDVRFPVGKIHEDQFTTYKILFACDQVVKIREKLYCYTVDNNNSITHSSFSIKRYDDLFAIDEALQFYKTNNKTDLYIAAQERKIRIQADYSLNARKVKAYSQVPKLYRMSAQTAWRVLEKQMDNDTFEYYMSQFYPRIIRFRAYCRKLGSLLKGKPTH